MYRFNRKGKKMVMGKVFEVIDVTIPEAGYFLGVFKTLQGAINAVKNYSEKESLSEFGDMKGYEILSIEERPFGFGRENKDTPTCRMRIQRKFCSGKWVVEYLGKNELF